MINRSVIGCQVEQKHSDRRASKPRTSSKAPEIRQTTPPEQKVDHQMDSLPASAVIKTS
jgi:hypothetical protein